MWKSIAPLCPFRLSCLRRFSWTGKGLVLFLLGNPNWFSSSHLLVPSQLRPKLGIFGGLGNLGVRRFGSTAFTVPVPVCTNTYTPQRGSLVHGMAAISTAPTGVQPPFVPMHESVWWKESDMRQEAVEKCVLPLTLAGHKGSSGRIGVLGGSARYTGAPFYAAMASLKVGADLAFCFCADEASIPIKSYSPELVVIPVYKASDFDALSQSESGTTTDSPNAKFLIQKMVDEVCDMLQKLHVLVIGPGLGRCPLVIEATTQILHKALSMNIPLVIDADALFILTLPKYKSILGPTPTSEQGRSNQSPIILTPNAMEWKRLHGLDQFWDHDRVVVVQKGKEDIIRFASSCKTEDVPGSVGILYCREDGGLKRSGGIGDILAGTLGTIIAWNSVLVAEGVATILDVPLACWLACSIVKRSTHVAYHEHHRAMTAPDVLKALGPTFHDMMTVNPLPSNDTTL